jgi:hypothetical protein
VLAHDVSQIVNRLNSEHEMELRLMCRHFLGTSQVRLTQYHDQRCQPACDSQARIKLSGLAIIIMVYHPHLLLVVVVVPFLSV